MAQAQLRSQFTEDELAQLAAHRVPFGVGAELDAVELAAAWGEQVARIDADRALPPFDRDAWNAYDLAGALFLRDHLATALVKLPRSCAHDWSSSPSSRPTTATARSPWSTTAGGWRRSRSWSWPAAPGGGSGRRPTDRSPTTWCATNCAGHGI